jgi:hypothetical protein
MLPACLLPPPSQAAGAWAEMVALLANTAGSALAGGALKAARRADGGGDRQ